MFDLERWDEIFETIKKNKLRTFLTGFSVFSGIFILVILLGVGQGIQHGVQHQFQRDAKNRINIWPGSTSIQYQGYNKNRQIQFKNPDFNRIVSQFGDNLEYSSPMYRIWSSMVSYKKESANYRVEGVHGDYQKLENESLVAGRYINHRDIEHQAKIAIIGHKVKKDLFPNSSPIGKIVKISGIGFKVVGVYSDPGGDRQEARLFIPLSTAQNVFSAGNKIRNMAFTLPAQETFKQSVTASENFIKRVKKQLKEEHHIAPNDDSAISFSNTIKSAKRIFFMIWSINAFFWVVGIATLLAGVVGVGNVMLIIVKERTKEIGIRKALGAKPWAIIGMILHESVFITAVAGFLGLFVGMALLEFVAPLIPNAFLRNPTVNFNIALTTVIILILAGALAGFMPAWRAARIKPIIALRDE